MTDTPAPLGIIAGQGELPVELADAAERAGRRGFVIALEGEASAALALKGRKVQWFEVGQFREILTALREDGIRDLLLAGKIDHITHMESGPMDPGLAGLLSSLEDLRGHTILRALTEVLAKEGFSVVDSTSLVPEMFPEPGVLAGGDPDEIRLRDITFGWNLAKKAAGLDIGQTVVVKNMSVVAVEALEGTDEAIRRGGRLAGGGIVAVKVSAEDHDFRFDVPTLGPETVMAMAQAGGGHLVLEAGKCILLDREQVLRLCRENGVSLISVDEGYLRGLT